VATSRGGVKSLRFSPSYYALRRPSAPEAGRGQRTDDNALYQERKANRAAAYGSKDLECRIWGGFGAMPRCKILIDKVFRSMLE